VNGDDDKKVHGQVAAATCRPPGYSKGKWAERQICYWQANITKISHFCWWNVSDDMCRMGQRPFWSWFYIKNFFTKLRVSAGEMYSMIYIQWAEDHFGFGLT